MARLPDLLVFAKEHGLKVGTIADLIQYRSAHESLLECLAQRPIVTPWGEFQLFQYRDKPGDAMHLALTHGDITPDSEVLVRVHEPLSVLDLIEPHAGSHSWPVGKALERIRQADCGVMVMLNCDGAGSAEPNQPSDDGPFDHASLNRKINLRSYGLGAQILRELGVRRMRILSQPLNMPSMSGFDLEVTGFET